MVPYEDLPDEDKDIIDKAMDEFQNKCLLSLLETTSFPRFEFLGKRPKTVGNLSPYGIS